MDYELILIRYGELSLKSRYVRNYFESTLVRNIKNVFRSHNVKCMIQKRWGRIYLYTDKIPRGVELLQRIFGITSISPAIKTTADMSSISEYAVEISKKMVDRGNSFALRVTRTGQHSFTSQDVAVKIGDDIVKATGASVDLNIPDFELFIEIRDDNAFVFLDKIQGTGGLPMGTQGKVLALIDSLQSILASWYLMRRGCTTIFVNIDECNLDALKSFISSWNADTDIFFVSKTKDFYNNLNKIASEKNCDAVVTGHTLYSKTGMSDIKSLKKYVNYPVLSPLITMDEKNINQKYKDVGIRV